MKRDKKLKKLTDDSDDEDSKPKNKCKLVWEGQVTERAFSKFDMKVCRTEAFAREHLARHNVPHYWDLALADWVIDQPT